MEEDWVTKWSWRLCCLGYLSLVEYLMANWPHGKGQNKTDSKTLMKTDSIFWDASLGLGDFSAPSESQALGLNLGSWGSGLKMWRKKKASFTWVHHLWGALKVRWIASWAIDEDGSLGGLIPGNTNWLFDILTERHNNLLVLTPFFQSKHQGSQKWALLVSNYKTQPSLFTFSLTQFCIRHAKALISHSHSFASFSNTTLRKDDSFAASCISHS